MEIKYLKKENSKDIFVIKDSDPAFVNTLRRTIIAEVPTLAIRKVTFIKNTSALFDEMLAHRLGLLPLVTDLTTYTLPEQCSCKGKGCAKCQLNFTLNCEGPLTVYSGDLKSADPKVKPAFAKMPVVKLLKRQELEFEAVATLGRGKEHIKFSPALVYYKGYPKIKISDKCNNCGDCVKECPLNLLEIEKKKLAVNDIEKCHLCKACEDSCPKKAIEVESSEKDFIFVIEPFGQLSTKSIITKALDEIEAKVDDFEEGIKKAK